MSEPTLLVADDHPLFRAALIQVLHDRFPQFRIVEAASAQTLGAAMQENPEIELVLLDLAMPGARGFSSLLHLRGEYAQVPVIIISSNDDPRIIRRAQQFGAAGFISKSAAADDMSAAIDDGILDIQFKVVSFSAVFYDNMGNAVQMASAGDSFTERMQEQFRRLARNRRFYITEVKAVGPDGITRNLPGAMEVKVR